MSNTARPFPEDLVLDPVSRWPTTLPSATLRAVLGASVEQQIQQVAQAEAHPIASILMVTFDGLAFTRLCLESLLAVPSSTSFELIVVDNGSTDGTVAYLQAAASRDARVRVCVNGRNAGFGAATNQGAAMARGRVLVFLNNDTIVSDGWLDGIVRHLADPRIGLLGVVTNRAGNEAEIDVPYRTYGEYRRFAEARAREQAGRLFDIRTVTMFCTAMQRTVWAHIGPIDERFALGLFEDDDYSMRARQAGYRVVCAEDVFIHHFGQASIGKLGQAGTYGPLFHANRARWEAKWGIEWRPYTRREKPAYRALVEEIRRVVRDTVPDGATVLVLSKGDPELLDLDGRRAWHFPRDEDGTYAGHHPVDSAACIDALEALRAHGGGFLVVPATMRWWLEHYEDFGRHLSDRYRIVTDRDTCLIVSLSEEADDA